MEKFDLVIIGAGPSGYAAAMRALDFKKKILLVERGRVGGAGVTNGALSSKTFWEISREVRQFNKHLKRYSIRRPEINFKEIQEEVKKAVQERIWILEDHIDLLRTSEFFKEYIHFTFGNARLLSNTVVSIDTGEEIRKVEAAHIILATGSKPRTLPDINVDEKYILTSDGIEHMDKLPESMVIVGAGVVGCEYATILSSLGVTHVNLIDKGDHILPFEDMDVVSVIETNLEKAGVHIHRNSTLTSLKVADENVEYELEYKDGTREIFHVERALISVGREANYKDLWDDSVGIKLAGRGVENNDTRTTRSNIYAIGDLTADIALVNVGELEGRHAVEKIFGSPKRPLMYENISTIMFLNPEVAGVGLNETQAKQAGLTYRVASLDYSVIPRAIAKRNTEGIIKLLVTDDRDMKILGMRVVGNQASSAIQAVALLISMDKGIEELAECVHPHPSITEGIQECVRMLLGKSMLKPLVMNSRISCRRFTGEVYEDLVFNEDHR